MNYKYCVLTLLTSICLLFQSHVINAQDTQVVKDVDHLGNLWVVTIDKSGSMNVGGNEGIKRSINKSIANAGIFSEVDYSKDHFVFYNSGITNKNGDIGKQLEQASDWSKSFIHNSEGRLGLGRFSFNNQNELIRHIDRIIDCGNFTYQKSFVSQIGLFAVVKVNNWVIENNLTDSYNTIKLAVFTDDADKDDQWLTDEKTIKKYSPTLDQEVKDANKKYLSSRINGLLQEAGYLEYVPQQSDEGSRIKAFRYDYYTVESRPDTCKVPVFKVKATDGESIRLTPLMNSFYKGYPITKYSVDSVFVDGNVYAIDQVSDLLNIALKYADKYTKHNIKICGSFQYRYDDAVLGSHYKKIPFTQYTTVLSGKQLLAINIFISLLSIIALALLLYYFIIRPNFVVATIYTGAGYKARIKRGFKSNWDNDDIQTACLNTAAERIIFKKHRWIKTEVFYTDQNCPYEILIASKRELDLYASNYEIRCTDNDIEESYFAQQGKYPVLLKHIYTYTRFSSLYKSLDNADAAIVRKFYNLVINITNLFCKTYYYAITDARENDFIGLGAPQMLDNRFIVEIDKGCSGVLSERDSLITKGALQYFNTLDSKPCNVLILVQNVSDSMVWSVVLLDKDLSRVRSLKSLYSVIHLKSGKNANYLKTLDALKKEVKKSIPDCKIAVISVDGATECNEYHFAITHAAAPGFISFVEETEEKNSQLLYSPIKDGVNGRIPVSLRGNLNDGHLVLSLLPFKHCKKHTGLSYLISKNLIHVDKTSTDIMKLENESLEYREINVML